jgi:hypothetical protein
MLNKSMLAIENAIYVIVFIVLLNFSNPPLLDTNQRVRSYTRSVEFDYASWTADAVLLKLQQATMGFPNSLDRGEQKHIVMLYLAATQDVLDLESAMEQVYSDPNVKDKKAATAHLRKQLDVVQVRQTELAPLAEAILQQQIATILTREALTFWGQPIPSVLYHSSATPNALIVSPRDHIEQITNISVLPDMTTDEKARLEDDVDKGLDVSSLVVGIGGIGVYPTMIMRTTNLSWLLNTIAHEWTHNFLTLRPLGALYMSTPELRTMNETTASIVGNEIGDLVLKEYYPEMSTASRADLDLVSLSSIRYPPASPAQDGFDFRAEMHETRVRADELLSQGKIEEAETYMEARRKIFWENGYTIRKLNQAYFAFFGAYADVPGGAAGEDPVGPAVRSLREQSPSLAEFVKTISWMTSFDELKAAVGK